MPEPVGDPKPGLQTQSLMLKALSTAPSLYSVPAGQALTGTHCSWDFEPSGLLYPNPQLMQGCVLPPGDHVPTGQTLHASLGVAPPANDIVKAWSIRGWTT